MQTGEDRYFNLKSLSSRKLLVMEIDAGYLSLESLDDDDENSQICIYCGIIPDVVLGKPRTN